MLSYQTGTEGAAPCVDSGRSDIVRPTHAVVPPSYTYYVTLPPYMPSYQTGT